MPSDENNTAILFADICGSTPLYETSGDRNALDMIAAALDDMTLIMQRNAGRVIRSKGDDLLCTFDTPVSALVAAAEILASIGNSATPVRMGMHYGPTIEARGDIFGDAVNVSARMLGLAKPGELLCSRAVVDRLPDEYREGLTPLGSRVVKGKDEPIDIYSMIQDDGESTWLVQPDTVSERVLRIQAKTHVVLRHAERTWTLRAGEPELRIGRSPRCQIEIADSIVSREHATVRVTPGRVSFVDHSTAGSWICIGDEPIMSLKRETFSLTGEGVICLGAAPTGKSAPARLGFSVRGVDTGVTRRSYSTTQLGGRIQARARERISVTPVPVQVTGAEVAPGANAALCDLSADGANLRADRCLGSEGDEVSVALRSDGPTLGGVLRYADESGPHAWSHGVKFTPLASDARRFVDGLLAQHSRK